MTPEDHRTAPAAAGPVSSSGPAGLPDPSPGADDLAQPPEQLRYARWLAWGTRLGVLMLLAGLVAALTGWLPPQVPPETVAQWWGQPVAVYREATGSAAGWGWLRQLAHGDMAGLLGIALLAASAVPPLLALLPLYLRRRDRIFAALCVAEIAVVALAASGWLRV